MTAKAESGILHTIGDITYNRDTTCNRGYYMQSVILHAIGDTTYNWGYYIQSGILHAIGDTIYNRGYYVQSRILHTIGDTTCNCIIVKLHASFSGLDTVRILASHILIFTIIVHQHWMSHIISFTFIHLLS